MPQAAPIIATAALAAGGAALSGAGLATVLLTALGTLALGVLQAVLAPKTSLNNERTQLLRQPVTARRSPFGELVIGGVLTEYEVTPGNPDHHMIVTLGDAPAAGWDGIDVIWLDDEPIFNDQIDDNNRGVVTSGRYKDVVWIKKHLGGPDQVADPDLIAEVGRLDSSFKGVGIAYLYIKLNWGPGDFPNGLPAVRAWCRTNTVLDTRDSTRRFTTNLPLILREYLTDTAVGLGYDAADLDDTVVQAAANTADEIVDARPVGHAVVQVDTTNDELDLAQAGSGASLRIETGDRVEIFTTGTAPGGLATATSYYAIVTRITGRTWKEGQEETIALDSADYTGDAATAIDDGAVDNDHRILSLGNNIHASVKLASSFADAMARTPIAITDAGTGQHLVIKTGEPRYHGAGVIEADMAPKDAIEEILSGMAGRLVWTGGVFHILPGAWRTPVTPTFDENDLFGPFVVRTRHSRRERFNSVRGIFATLLATGEQTDYPNIIDSTYVANDGGVEIFDDHDLPWTSRAATAQRLAKIRLARHRRETRVEMTTSPKGFLATPGSIVQLSNTRRGWTDKTFEVMEWGDVELPSEAEGDLSAQGVKLMLAELDSTAFDFDPTTDETIKPPEPTLRGGNPLEAEAPSDLDLASGDDQLFLKKDGTVVSRIKVSWVVNDAFATHTEVQYKRSVDTAWSALGLIDTDQAFAHVWDVEDGVSYDVRVRTISDIGVRSDWVQAPPHQVVGKTAPPPDVDTFTVTRMADGTRRFAWTATPPADVTAGGGFKIRYVVGTGGAWAGMSELHTGLLSASPYETNELAAGTYTFGIKMVDSSGNESTNAVLIEATLGDPRLREVLLSRDEALRGWDGTLVDGFITPENTLEATSDGSWSGDESTWTGLASTWTGLASTWAGLASGGTGNKLPDTWDELADKWREILPNNSPMTYTTGLIDLGTDVTFTPLVTVSPSTGVSLSMQTGTDADGGPVGSFVPLANAEGVRYVKIKAQVTGTFPVLDSMVTLLDGDTQVEDYEDVDTSAASAGVFERIATGHFKLATRGNTASITSATIRAFQSAGSGWTWELLDKATTITGGSEPAAEFKIYKDGTLTDATIDAEIKGPKK